MADTLALSPDVPRAAANTGATLWVSSFVVARRMVRKFVRTPQLIAFTAIQSALFLFMFRFAFGGAIGTGGSLSYVNFLVPGFIATTVLWSGVGAATGVAEDVEHGFIDRLRSLPIPRAAVLIGRSLADTALLVWGLAIAVAFGFAVGFRLHGSVSGALAAFGLCVVFGFAFEWIFIVIGLVSGTAQAAQQMGLVITPLVFLSSAYVPVASMPGGVRQFSEFQPVTPMVDAVRRLTAGPQGQALLPHSIGHYVALSLVWAAAIFVLFGLLAVLRFARR
ncbi:MAG TPA: ABC transporter permease [Streptosporangiaceae bacterium]|nr:ABC transporter permease [Streptosporangiaceae bacterium]